MTIICYRDGVLASDSLITGDGFRAGEMRKLARSPNGVIAGSAGIAGVSHRFTTWVENGMGEPFEPKCESHEFCALLIWPSGRVQRMEGSGELAEFTAPFHVEGCGERIALGALEMGATAEQAVAAAIKWDCGCGGPIQVLRMEDKA